MTGRRPSRPPQNGPKHPKRSQKRVLAITLARRGVAGQIDPTFPCILRLPNRFRWVRDPNGTLWTPYGEGGGRAGRARKNFRAGSGGSKNFFHQNFFDQKRYSLGPEWVWGPKNRFWTPLDPPKVAIWTQFTYKMAQMGPKNGQKNTFFHKNVFAPN